MTTAQHPAETSAERESKPVFDKLMFDVVGLLQRTATAPMTIDLRFDYRQLGSLRDFVAEALEVARSEQLRYLTMCARDGAEPVDAELSGFCQRRVDRATQTLAQLDAALSLIS